MPRLTRLKTRPVDEADLSHQPHAVALGRVSLLLQRPRTEVRPKCKAQVPLPKLVLYDVETSAGFILQ